MATKSCLINFMFYNVIFALMILYHVGNVFGNSSVNEELPERFEYRINDRLFQLDVIEKMIETEGLYGPNVGPNGVFFIFPKIGLIPNQMYFSTAERPKVIAAIGPHLGNVTSTFIVNGSGNAPLYEPERIRPFGGMNIAIDIRGYSERQLIVTPALNWQMHYMDARIGQVEIQPVSRVAKLNGVRWFSVGESLWLPTMTTSQLTQLLELDKAVKKWISNITDYQLALDLIAFKTDGTVPESMKPFAIRTTDFKFEITMMHRVAAVLGNRFAFKGPGSFVNCGWIDAGRFKILTSIRGINAEEPGAKRTFTVFADDAVVLYGEVGQLDGKVVSDELIGDFVERFLSRETLKAATRPSTAPSMERPIGFGTFPH